MLKTVKPRDLTLESDGTYPTSSQDQLDLSRDRQIITLANSFRRTVIIERDNGNSFGFSLQSILIEKKNSPDQEPKRVTFVSKVDDDSPADLAGIVPGDVIVAVDGEVVVELRHSELVSLIQKKSKMRVIVVFEDMVRKVELISLYLKLEKEIQKKQEELAAVEEEEKKILEKMQQQPISIANSSMESPDDSSSGFEDMAFSEIASSRVSIKSESSWSFDETSVQFC